MTKDETKANEEVIAKNGVKAMLFDDVQKLILRHYDELFPNYEWMDYMESLGLMAAEVKVLRSELLDALRLATDMRCQVKPIWGDDTPERWDKWKKLCARLEALLLEVRGRWYAATLPAALGLTDSAAGPIRCGTFSVAAQHQLVMIEWVDSYGCSANWQDLENPHPTPMVCKSVGWLYHNGSDCKLIVPHVADGDQFIPRQGCGDMTIPASAVRRIVPLAPTRKRTLTQNPRILKRGGGSIALN